MYQTNSGITRYYFGLNQEETRVSSPGLRRPSHVGQKIHFLQHPEETKDRFRFSLNVQGVDPRDIAVTVDGNYLVVEFEKEFKPFQVAHTAWDKQFGIFERRFEIPEDVDKKMIHFQVHQGELRIDLFKQDYGKTKAPQKPATKDFDQPTL